MSACIFCSIVAGQAPASVVYEDEFSLAFLDIRPVTPGHILVIPKTHANDLAALDPALGAHLFTVAQKIAAGLRAAAQASPWLRVEGVNLFLADGEAAGQEVFHVHLHVFPRFRGDSFKIRAAFGTRPQRAELDAQAEGIRRALPDGSSLTDSWPPSGSAENS